MDKVYCPDCRVRIHPEELDEGRCPYCDELIEDEEE